MTPPLAVNLFVGALGAGKTTLITELMAAKPMPERWVVLLNELSESGIDALTVASAACGAYDVQLLPGGCLCCSGELDFARRMRELLRVAQTDRVLIELSGLGHPAAVLGQLLAWQRQGAIRVAAVLGLIEPRQLPRLAAADAELLRAQLDAADTLVLSKAAGADDGQLLQWRQFVATRYPAPLRSVEWRAGAASLRWLDSGASPEAPLLAPLAGDAHRHWRVQGDAMPIMSPPEQPLAGMPEAWFRSGHQLAQAVVSWRFAPAWQFARPALWPQLRALAAGGQLQRFKAVLRAGPEHWLLLQWDGACWHERESAWRQDSRAEWLLPPALEPQRQPWLELWRGCARYGGSDES